MELKHHGIPGQKWGKRNGPPYPLKGGQYSETEKQEYKKTRRQNSRSNKQHFDKTITTKDTLSTLSYDKNRTSNASFFYAAYDKQDKAQYRAMFNKAIKSVNGVCFKSRINNSLKDNIKVASEDSGANAFKKLYSQSRDLYNFVTDPERMQKAFVDEKYKFKGYREARDVLDKIRAGNYTPIDKDVQTLYRMFNYVLPFTSQSDPKLTKDVSIQRQKLFSELKKEGYGAVLDTNDALYGGYKANAPVIVFDSDKVVLSSIKDTSFADPIVAQMEYAGRKLLGRLK